jgi:hypothetical protein
MLDHSQKPTDNSKNEKTGKKSDLTISCYLDTSEEIFHPKENNSTPKKRLPINSPRLSNYSKKTMFEYASLQKRKASANVNWNEDHTKIKFDSKIWERKISWSNSLDVV